MKRRNSWIALFLVVFLLVSNFPVVTYATSGDTIDWKEQFKDGIESNIVLFNKTVRNDKTGRWRLTRIATTKDVVDYVTEYYKAYFESDDEIHFVINFTLNTTTVISQSGHYLYVTTHKYVTSEEHDANILAEGDVLGEYQVNLDNGEVIDLLSPSGDDAWKERYENTKEEIKNYIDYTILAEYKKRVETEIEYSDSSPDTYYGTVDLKMNISTPEELKNALKTIEERIEKCPYNIQMWLIITTNNTSLITALGSEFDNYTITLQGHRYKYNSLDDIPTDLF